jgi:hypothetical protein
VGQAGWEEVADFALQWATEQLRSKITLADAVAGYSADRQTYSASISR